MPQPTLSGWLRHFDIQPVPRTSPKQFSEEAFRLLEKVKTLRDEKLSLDAIKERLSPDSPVSTDRAPAILPEVVQPVEESELYQTVRLAMREENQIAAQYGMAMELFGRASTIIEEQERKLVEKGNEIERLIGENAKLSMALRKTEMEKMVVEAMLVEARRPWYWWLIRRKE